MGSCTEELWPSFRTSESDGVWKREGTQEELEKEREDGLETCEYLFKGKFRYFSHFTCQVRTVHEC